MTADVKMLALVRGGRGGEWLDVDTLADNPNVVLSKADMDDVVMGPSWTTANPRMRIVRVSVTETETVRSL